MPEPIPPAKPDFMANLLKGINRVVTPDGKVEDAPAPELPVIDPNVPPVDPPKPKLPGEGRTIGEIAVEAARLAKASADAPPAPPVTPPVVPPVVPTVEPPVVPAPPRLKKKPDVIPALSVVQPPVVVTPPPAVVPPVAATADDEYIKSLTPDQQDEIQMAAFAETKFPELKGKKAEVLGYFKKVDAYAQAHPDAQPGSEDFDEFIKNNRPKYSPSLKRKVETAFVVDQARSEIRNEVMAEVRPELERQKKVLHQQQVAPVIQKAVDDFQDYVTSKDALPDPAMETIPADAAKLFHEKGYQALVDEYPVEGPILASSMNASREWLNLTNGLTTLDQNNATHKWLLNFVADQGRIWQANPASTVNGRQFLPIMEYMDMAAKNPAEVAKYHTFSDADVLRTLASNAVIQCNAQLKSLEKSGFTRAKKSGVVPAQQIPPVPPVAPAPVIPPNTPSPRLRSSSNPNPGDKDKAHGPAYQLLNALAPGAAERVGI